METAFRIGNMCEHYSHHCVDGDDVNFGATNGSVADVRVDNAGGL